jgi:hypothetical protein
MKAANCGRIEAEQIGVLNSDFRVIAVQVTGLLNISNY